MTGAATPLSAVIVQLRYKPGHSLGPIHDTFVCACLKGPAFDT